MVTLAQEPEPEPEETLADRLAPVSSSLRTLLGGSPNAPWRRTVLFIIVAIGLAFADPILPGLIGLAALLMLALTDQVVNL